MTPKQTMRNILILSILVLLSSSCLTKKHKSDDAKPSTLTNKHENVASTLQLTGLLEKQGITTYQYGTHVLKTKDVIYALKSDAIDLSLFVGKSVQIKGEPVKGYPVSGGPIYVNVISIE
jgi:hypothetical protein